MDLSDVIVEEGNAVPGYVDTPQMSVSYTLEFFEHFQKNHLAILEPGR